MKLSQQIKPVSYLKSHTAEIIRNLQGQQDPLIITQNGKATIVVQGIESYEQTQEAIALLKILTLGNLQIEAGKIHAASDVIKQLQNRDKDN